MSRLRVTTHMARVRAVPAAALVAVAACGRGAATDAVEQQISRDLAAQLGVPIPDLRCPAGPYPKTCAGGGLEVEVVAGADGLDWSLVGFVITTAPIVAEIGDALDDLGVAATIDCGPLVQTAAVGVRLRCRLGLGATEGAAWARILGDDEFELELALDPAAVAARSGVVDDAELERQSLALDVDDPLGDDDDDGDGAGDDAGVAVVPEAPAP